MEHERPGLHPSSQHLHYATSTKRKSKNQNWPNRVEILENREKRAETIGEEEGEQRRHQSYVRANVKPIIMREHPECSRRRKQSRSSRRKKQATKKF
jgi:hypothetical protein